MKTIKLFFLTVLLTSIISCSKDDSIEQFTGEVTVTLLNKGATEAMEGEAIEFIYDVILSRSFDTDIKLNISLEKLTQYPGLLTIMSPITITKNTTKGVLKVISTAKVYSENQLTKTESFAIKLDSYTGISNAIVLIGNPKITVKAEEDFTPLTKAQKELLAHYKTNGIDLSLWIGKIPVEVTVNAEGNGSFSPFDAVSKKTYKGITYITLSSEATKEKPMLVMTNNAFGLSEYLQYVFRKETIENRGFWYNPSDQYVSPAAKAVLKALGSTREQKWLEKEYAFNVKVDELEFKSDKTVQFVYENGAYNNPHKSEDPTGVQDDEYELITAVNFEYEFPLWDELLNMVKTNNKLYEDVITGGSVHPDYYLTYSKIDEDDWDDGNWVKPVSNYDNTKGEMTYKFNFDHYSSGGYDIITVKYKSPYKK